MKMYFLQATITSLQLGLLQCGKCNNNNNNNNNYEEGELKAKTKTCMDHNSPKNSTTTKKILCLEKRC